MLRRCCIALATALLATTSTAQPPVLPCRTPEQLLSAVRYALENQDTNLFWRLHCWTNVPPKSQWVHKEIMSVHFKKALSDELTFSSFKIIQPPPGYTNVVRFKNGAERHFTIPVSGIIYFRKKGKEANPIFPSELTIYSADGEAPFGRSPDGTYALAVQAGTPGTNTPPNFKLPPGGITNLLRR
jgi:hypothetical protein